VISDNILKVITYRTTAMMRRKGESHGDEQGKGGEGIDRNEDTKEAAMRFERMAFRHRLKEEVEFGSNSSEHRLPTLPKSNFV